MAKNQTSPELGDLAVRSVEEAFRVLIQAAPAVLSLIETVAEAIRNPKHEWLDMKKAATKWKVNTQSDAAAGSIVLVSNVGVQVGDVLGYEASTGASIATKTKVTAVNGNGTTLSITRIGTDVNIPANAVVTLISRAKPENSGEDLGINDLPVMKFNYTQIFRRDFGLSRTAIQSQIYGDPQDDVNKKKINDLKNLQSVMKLREIMWELNQTLIQGIREQRADGGANGSSGGLIWFAEQQASSRYDASSAKVTADIINNAFDKAANNGADPSGMTIMLCSSVQARFISTFNNAKLMIQRQDTTTGNYVGAFQTDLAGTNGGGLMTLVVDRNFPKDKILIFNPNNVKIRNIKELFEEETTQKKTDGQTWKILGEKTIEIHNAADEMMLIENLALS